MSLQTITIGPTSLGMDGLPLGRDFFEKLLDSLYDGVYFVDTQRQILFWNRGAERLTGYAQEEVVGRYCFEELLQHTDEEGCRLCHDGCPLMKTIASGMPSKARVYLLHKDQRRIAVDVHVTPLRTCFENGCRPSKGCHWLLVSQCFGGISARHWLTSSQWHPFQNTFSETTGTKSLAESGSSATPARPWHWKKHMR